jgi:hypothetical protein
VFLTHLLIEVIQIELLATIWFAEGGWSYSVLASRRLKKGFVNGSLYDSNSFFAAVENNKLTKT